ncbi:unnamed protein product [Polarella glacialis]|uniref:B30.2/SPRY domain-containing protein n=1 Tax=Polarella glacialis TaxID=89957 RepID=A0A813EIW9_POLGL|nr:unnamed protein product [Polarella glacialis]
MNGHTGVLELLQKVGADLEAASGTGATPAFLAANFGRTKVLRLLLESKANLETLTIEGMAPAHEAASSGRVKVLEFLREVGVDLQARCLKGNTPLICAVKNGRVAAINCLLAARVDVNASGYRGIERASDCSRAALNSNSDDSNAKEVLEILQQAGGRETSYSLRGLKPLRPIYVPCPSTWLTSGAPHLCRSSGRFYHEVQLDTTGFDEPWLGWLTTEFVESKGLGDDEHGWAANGQQQLQKHSGKTVPAEWPSPWMAGDTVGLALDIEGGLMQFSLNGQWVLAAAMSFSTSGQSFFPAVSMKGFVKLHLCEDAWRFAAPQEGFEAWTDSGEIYEWCAEKQQQPQPQ